MIAVVWLNGNRYEFTEEVALRKGSVYYDLLDHPKAEWKWFNDKDVDKIKNWNPGQEPKSQQDVWLEVMKDMESRRKVGLQRYNKAVTVNSGEHWLQHMYEELLDAAVYVKAQMLEDQTNGTR